MEPNINADQAQVGSEFSEGNSMTGDAEDGTEEGEGMESEVRIPVLEEVEMNLNENSQSESVPIPIDSLRFQIYPDYVEHIGKSAAEDIHKRSDYYCRRLLPFKSQVRAIYQLSQLQTKRIQEGSSGVPSHCGLSVNRTVYTDSGETGEKLGKDQQLYDRRTLFIIHPLLKYISWHPSYQPDRCILPTRISTKPQVYEISRNDENPSQVEVQLEEDFVYPDSDEEVKELCDSEEAAVEAAPVPATTEPIEVMPCKSETLESDPCAYKFAAAGDIVRATSASSVQLSPTTNTVAAAPPVIQISSQPVYSGNSAVFFASGKPSYIVPASTLAAQTIITSTPTVIQREIILPGINNHNLFPGARLIVTTTPVSGPSIVNQFSMAKSAEKEGSGEGKSDVTTDGESSRPGYVTVCHNCGTESKNFHCCDSCRRTIPRGSKVLPDRLHQAFLSGIKTGPGINSSFIAERKTPTRKKRAVKHRQPEEVTLSSDEESCDSPEKKLKLADDPDKIANSDEAAEKSGDTVSNGNPETKESDNMKEEGSSCHDSAQQDASFDNKEMLKIRETMKARLSSGSSMSYIQLKCRSFRVGSYKYVDNVLTNGINFQAYVLEDGILFRMPHLQRQRELVDVVIPKHAVLQITGCFDSKRLCFLLIQTANKIAKWIRQILGMTVKEDSKVWFEPFKGDKAEKFVVLMVEAFSPEQVAFINTIFGSKIVKNVDATEGNQMLLEISTPETTDSTQKAGASNIGSVGKGEQIVRVNSPVVTQPIIDPAKVSSTSSKPASCNNIPGVKKINLRSQQDKQKNGKLPGNKTEEDTLYNGAKTIFQGKTKQLISLQQRDLMTLQPEQFLNDQIIDFWLSYVYRHLLNEGDRQRTYLFSTFFYNRLTTIPRIKTSSEYDKSLSAAEKRHRRVKKWTKNVDLFSKDFIIVPINDSCHWYVAIICFPGLKGPHWMSGDTPIENWLNLTKENGKPKFTRPPGMPERADDKPPKKKPKKRVEVPPTEAATSSADKPSSGNGGGIDTDLDGNPVLQGDKQPAAPEADDQKQSTQAKSAVVGSSENGEKKLLPSFSAPPTAKSSQIIMHEEMPICAEDPFKDEAKDDSDEDYLINEYYFSDDESDEEKEESPPKSPQPSTEEAPIPSAEARDENGPSPSKPEADVKVESQEGNSEDMATRTDFRIKQPCILLFNSLPGLARTRVFATLRDYLRVEYKERKGEERAFSKFDMPGFEPNVPQQKNLCDCGVYLVEYVERFFSNPLESYLLALPTSLRKWFPQLKSKRKDMYDKICELIKEENPDNLRYVPKFEVLPPPTPVAAAAAIKGSKLDPKSVGKANEDASSKTTLLKLKKVDTTYKVVPTLVVSAKLPEETDSSKPDASSKVASPKMEEMDTTEKAVTPPVAGGKSPGKPGAGKPGRKRAAKKVVTSQESCNSVPTVPVGGVEIPITVIKDGNPVESGSNGSTESSEKLVLKSASLVSPSPSASKKVKTNRRRSSSAKETTKVSNDSTTDQAKQESAVMESETTVAEVEAAPRQKLIPTTPEEEPMDIDPITE